ncbi:acyl carrier protein [Allocatelliglobosispora scoriae]|uniref:Acyl carrier protein n=1 Tax=Allocatelliglobosispora scoriae TaxID=643052 RepID=A0A841BI43_9ACTN|nr:acyl carrier protein [Allocatelliglobosispora scoriae]MBB5866733.1 acyl carrier protein [Allocatelliglobosispora scoriae]
MSTEARLRDVFDRVLELDETIPDGELRYQKTSGWDSLGSVLLVASIEDEFGVEIDIERSLTMDTFAAAVGVLRDLGVEG